MPHSAKKNASRLRLYIQLLRLDQPTGIWLLLWPSLWSIAFASGNTFHYDLYIIFALGALLMRSAGCVINDIIDRRVDAKVARTKHRPLASGRISLFEAIVLAGIFLAGAYALLMQLGTLSQYLGFAVSAMIVAYPFMKRITYWPQLFLGITFNWGVLMGWASVRDDITLSAALLYTAAVFWTLGFDTIYGHQDKEDDALLGLKSTALKYGKKTRSLLYLSYGITALLLWIIGIMHGIGMIYFACLFIGIIHLGWQATAVDFNKPEQCMAAFRSNRFFGALIFFGIVGGTWLF